MARHRSLSCHLKRPAQVRAPDRADLPVTRRRSNRSRTCRNNPPSLGTRVSEGTQEPYTLRTTPTVRRELAETLPEAVAAAAYEFITGPLLNQPRRVGKQLLPPLDDTFSARRGTYRVIYRIDEAHVVTVGDIAAALRQPGFPSNALAHVPGARHSMAWTCGSRRVIVFSRMAAA